MPSNLFDFEAPSAAIDISGSLSLKFAGAERVLDGGPNRMLQAGGDIGNLFDLEEEEAAFDLRISLLHDGTVGILGNEEEEEDGNMKSAKTIAGKSLAILGMIVVSVYALW